MVMRDTWYTLDEKVDQQFSGIWADWIEEHPEHVFDDPAGIVPQLVGYLRARFDSQSR